MSKVILYFLLSLILLSCSKAPEYVFIVDTSGSMKKDNQLKKVKNSLREITYKEDSDSIAHLILFDEEINDLGEYQLNKENLLRLYGDIDAIEAKGQWTNLIGALDYSLDKVTRLKTNKEKKDINLIIYTDGKHDLPKNHPDYKKLDFDHLFNKYFKGHKQKKVSWYIYYVELDESDPAVKRFIKETNRGVVISSKQFESFPNIMNINLSFLYNPLFYIYAATIFLAFFILYFLFKPWFKSKQWIHVVGSRGAQDYKKISLSEIKRKLFRNYITIGKSGEIKISSSSLAKIDAGLGVDIFGNFFVKKISGCPVKVNDIMVNKKRRFRLNDKVLIGDACITIVKE